MSTCTIIDAGPLVALLYKSDSHHNWAKEQVARLPPPYLTCDAVLSEVCFLLSSAGVSPNPVFELVARGVVKLDFPLSAEFDAVRRLMTRYEDIRISLADACLVRMSELHQRCAVMTIDRDFLIYRRDGRRIIPLVAPFDG